ncbi:hypothetical protein BT96DRAFT_855706 [Gymnopus androsaceus JB14]|uniref:SWIM-type domain-containing protein n=1 Tax=Gymnopus androsaceus JB14 TaxID=1447944 RepID=A0A6A4HZ82_9AGAR|nr:hypothetical protein BT96DRAFT_855706 [Gymnopus androsaceus JB14]
MVLQKRKANGTYEAVNEPSLKKFRTDTHTSLPSTSSTLPGASSPSASTPSTGKGKGRKKAEPKEKRQARYRGSCPNDISVRLDRYLSQAQRIYLIERNREGNALKEEFVVQGSTGNVYTITIDNVPHCDCPDHQKGHHCKHLLFVLLKVLQIPQSSNYWYQKALLTSKLAEIFAAAPPPPQLRGSFIANDKVVGAWREATGREPTSTVESSSAPAGEDPRRVPITEDDCPICYDKMNAEGLDLKGLETSLEWCNECHNAVHKECWTQWRTTKQKQGQALSCVYCRSDWTGTTAAGGTGGAAAHTDEGFVNLAGVSGVSTVRDTSTYHQSPPSSYYGYSSSRYGYGRYGTRY